MNLFLAANIKSILKEYERAPKLHNEFECYKYTYQLHTNGMRFANREQKGMLFAYSALIGASFKNIKGKDTYLERILILHHINDMHTVKDSNIYKCVTDNNEFQCRRVSMVRKANGLMRYFIAMVLPTEYINLSDAQILEQGVYEGDQ